MNGQIRAVRAAERQLRQLPAPVEGILLLEALAGRLEPDTGWADVSPLGTLVAGDGAANKSLAAPANRGRAGAPEPSRAPPRGGAAEVLQGATAAAGRALQGLGEATARAAAGGEAPGSERRSPGSRLVEAISGGSARLAAPGGATREPSPTERAAVFSLAALRRASSASAKGARGAGRQRAADVPGGFAAALAGQSPTPPGAGAVTEVAGEVAGAALGVAGGALAAAEVLSPAIAAIGRRLEQVAARVSRAGESGQVSGAGRRITAAGGQPGAARSGAGGHAAPESAPRGSGRTSGASTGPIVIAPVDPEVERTEAPQRTAAREVDPDWVVAVVGDALLEQARRQGVDLT